MKKGDLTSRQRGRCIYLVEDLRVALSRTRRLATKGSWKDAKLAVDLVLDKIRQKDTVFGKSPLGRSKFDIAVGNKIRCRLNVVEESICFAEYLRYEYHNDGEDYPWHPCWDEDGIDDGVDVPLIG
tara:strand:- start:202 stop:579 length:378 start_codon:yes stop_codon:yes gene_type:complete